MKAPEENNQNIYDNIFKKKCAVCGQTYMADIYDQGKCENCGWYNGMIYGERPDDVIFSNMLSLNRARQLYKENKPLKPGLDDFLAMLYFYSEVEFWYNGLECCVSLGGDNETKIEFGWSPESTCYFSNKDDFIQNAKIGNEFVRDIWDKVENADYV